MNRLAGSLPLIVPVGLLMALGVSGLGFHFFAVHAFDVGTDHEYIPQLKKSSPPPAKCVKQR
ncbi:MAG TPA: hypothetical protein VG826_08550 [Pirellulales bacterium]|nr:hypothetical protein [Pirellulales bacterium]